LSQNILRHIFLFDYKDNVFGKAVTTSAILMLAKDSNYKKIHFSVINTKEGLKDISRVIDNYPKKDGNFTFKSIEVNPEIKWRAYYQNQESKKFNKLVPFSNFAKVVRGIATGSNNYFIFNKSKAKEFNISQKYLINCIAKSKDIHGSFFTSENCKALEDSDANIYIFDGVSGIKNDSVLNYIKTGETEGINKKYLTSRRNPWFSIENRSVAPIWVGVFNRKKGIKFIRNEAKIRNLTTFHCVYFSDYKGVDLDLFFAYLLTEVAHKILGDNRREYGGGLNKFEPNDLNNALMLDISTLSTKNKEDIKLLYKNYRDSALIGCENKEYIDNINDILLKEFT
jgi:adenine-specific DNA-methyltransferase